jgi:hypothetical protein
MRERRSRRHSILALLFALEMQCTVDVTLSVTNADVPAPRDDDRLDGGEGDVAIDSPVEDVVFDAIEPDVPWDATIELDGNGHDASPNVGRWQRVAVPTFADLRAVWGSDARDVWIVGDRSTLLRWTGTIWSPYASPAPSTSYRGVWGSAPDDVWAAGYDTFGNLVVVRWDGRSWSRWPTMPMRYLPRAVWGTSRSDAWIVGSPVDFSGDIVLRWDGTRWSTIRTGGSPTRYLDIGGTRADDLWIIALDDTLLRWDGARFDPRAATLPVAVVTFELGLWSSGVGELWITGDAGTMHRFERGAWSSVNAGTRNLLRSVWGVDANHVWAVGTRGTIARYNGRAWGALEDLTPRTLFSVWGSSADDVWVVGEGGTVLHSVP